MPILFALLAIAVVAALVLGRGWQLEKVMETGDLMSGEITMPDEPGGCPGATSFYINGFKTRFSRRPTDAESAGLLRSPPPPIIDVASCPGSCVNVLTHIWHSWFLTRNQLTRRWTFHVITYSQFRCMEPSDPEVKKPPVMGNPRDPSRPPMA